MTNKRGRRDYLIIGRTDRGIAVVDELPLEQTDHQRLDVRGDRSDNIKWCKSLLDLEYAEVHHDSCVSMFYQLK